MVECPYCQKKFENSIELETHMKEYKQENGKGEQLKHKHLKSIAKDFLRELGFAEEEIKEEYWLDAQGMRERVRVDVVGLSSSRKVAIECGQVSGQKMSWLNLFFDEVINLPYANDRVSHGSCSEALIGRVKELQKELEESRNRIVTLKRQLESKTREVDEQKIILGKATIVGLYKMGALPTRILHVTSDLVIKEFEEELQARTNPPYPQVNTVSLIDMKSETVGLSLAKVQL
jgi:hypothetical protein